MKKSTSLRNFLFTQTHLLLCLLLIAVFPACNSGDDVGPDKTEIIIQNIEIGSGNNGIGIIGRDFHFDMDVEANNRIENIEILIRQRTDGTYSKEWSFKITWEEFKGVRNTNVHKHFDIPGDAPEGDYDFVVRISDESGDVLEEAFSIKLVSTATLPVDPQVYSLMVNKVGVGFFYIMNRGFVDPEVTTFVKGEKLNSYVDIRNVKDDGALYVLLIKKSESHLPETVENIDFTKVTVADVWEHAGLEEVTTINNYVGLTGNAPRELVIGAALDHNLPSSNTIEGNKAWENGEYYYGIVYTNKTHNMSAHYYFKFNISGF